MRVRLVIRRLRVWHSPGRQHSQRLMFSMTILSLPLIPKGQLSVSGDRMCTRLVNRLEDLAYPVKVWLGNWPRSTWPHWVDWAVKINTNKTEWISIRMNKITITAMHYRLTFTAFWANLAEDKLMFFLFCSQENRLWHVMQT